MTPLEAQCREVAAFITVVAGDPVIAVGDPVGPYTGCPVCGWDAVAELPMLLLTPVGVETVALLVCCVRCEAEREC